MWYFNRVCQIVIESKKKILVEDSKIRFEIIKSSEAKDNSAKVEIYNLAPATRKAIVAEDSLVRIYAGYRNNQGLIEIGQGDITKIKNNRSKTEVVTELYLAEGLRKMKINPVQFSFAQRVKLSEIIDELKKQTSFAFRFVDIDTSQYIPNGYADLNSLDVILDNLSFQYGFNWSVQSGIITLKGTNRQRQKEVMLLSAETGLILNPESLKQTSRSLKKANKASLEQSKLSIQALLQPQLQVHDVIAVKSHEIKGNFAITKITHSGDTRSNEWYSNMEVVAA